MSTTVNRRALSGLGSQYLSPLLIAGLIMVPAASANVGVIAYESKGTDARRATAGHVALIATDLCPEGFHGLRKCRPGEPPGAIIHRYPNLAPNYKGSVMVVPILVHLFATDDWNRVPVISSGGTLEAMQIEYWRTHLRGDLPPLTQQEYEQIKAERTRFDFGRTVRQFLTFEFLGVVMGANHKRYQTEPIAIPDPKTQELIPNGRWREVIGASHQRTLTIITAAASEQQEEKLIEYIKSQRKSEFNALSDNCSDFAKRGLLAVYSDSGLSFRNRPGKYADAFITSPISVLTDFLRFTNKNDLPVNVTYVPMIAGTRRATLPITSLARGTLIPNPEQGKVAFGLKVFVNMMNPMLIAFAFGADTLSHMTDVQKVVHQRNGPELSAMAFDLRKGPETKDGLKAAIAREQMKVFGAPSCWAARKDQFRTIAKMAQDRNLLGPSEMSALLKTAQPFLIARHYEKAALRRRRGGDLVAGMQRHPPLGAAGSFAMTFVPAGHSASYNGGTGWHPNTVPGRPEVLEMAQSGDREKQAIAFRLMTSLINYDLTSDASHRRSPAQFDPDWNLFLKVAEENGLRIESARTIREPVEECSCRRFDSGAERRDAFGKDIAFAGYAKRQTRNIVYSPAR